MNTLYGHEIVGQQTILSQGCFTRTRYWLRGHICGFLSYASYIIGSTGPETVLEIDAIFPTTTFDVLPYAPDAPDLNLDFSPFTSDLTQDF